MATRAEELKQAVPNKIIKNACDRGMYEGFRQAALEKAGIRVKMLDVMHGVDSI